VIAKSEAAMREYAAQQARDALLQPTPT